MPVAARRLPSFRQRRRTPQGRKANRGPASWHSGFDDLNIDAAALKPAKAAAERSSKPAWRQATAWAVVTTAQPRDAEFIGDVPGLVERIAKVTAHRRFSEDASPQCPRIRPYEAYLIVNHLDNQVLEAKVAEYQACGGRVPRPQDTVTSMAQGVWQYALMKLEEHTARDWRLGGRHGEVAGERMILLTSAGFLTGDLEADEDLLLAKALHAEVVIDTLDARGLYTVLPGDDASDSPPPGRVPRRAQVVEAAIAGPPGRGEGRRNGGSGRRHRWHVLPTTATIWCGASGSWGWRRKPCTCSASRRPARLPTAFS